MRTRLLFILSAILLLTSCTAGDYDCEGEIIIENEIPDISLELGGEPFRRDVFEEPVVFRHTVGKHISISPISEDIAIVSASGKRNEETGDVTVLKLTANSIGTVKVNIIARDECPDYEKITSFQVTVVDSSSAE